MKKLILVVVCALVAQLSLAQNGPSFGLKAGLNYNANGDYFESISTNAENPDRNIGYHLGFYGKFGNSLYFRPELIYTKTKSDYDSGGFDYAKVRCTSFWLESRNKLVR